MHNSSSRLSKIALIPILLVFLAFAAFSEGINQHYSSGLTLFQSGKFTEASEQFQLALQDEPENPFILFNLGLTQYKMQKLGSAMGFWRRAQYYYPGFSRAEQALKVASESLKMKAIPHQITLMETYRQSFLFDLDPDWYLAGAAIFLFLFGWRLLKFLGRRRLENGTAAFSPTILVALILFLFFGTLAALKIFDNAQTRATVIVEKIEAHSGPSKDQANLFDLFEGFEVIVRQSIEDEQHHKWTQVTYPGGMTGWVAQENLLFHSGENL